MMGFDGASLRIQGPQGRLQVQVRGVGGTPIILVHGNGARGRQWGYQLEALGRRHRVAALDLRGMGGAQAPRNGDYSVGAFADDVAAVADALQWNSFFLVGHSLGGFVSACCACRFPGRVPGLVFVDHGGDVRNDSREDLDALTRGLLPEHLEAFSREATETCLKGARPDVRDQVLADLRATPSAAFAGAILGLLDFDEPAALERYAGPKLHLYSDFLAAHQLTPIHALVPGCESSLVPDCSHWIHLDQPEVFNARVEAFLARCAAGSCR